MPFDLNALDADYQAAVPAEKGSGDTVPDGKYIAFVHKVEVVETKTGANKGKPRLSWQLIIEGGDYHGRYVFKSNQMVTAQNLSWLKADLKVCGVVLGKLGEMPDRLANLLDKRIRITLKNKPGKPGKDDMVNIFFDGLATEPATPPTTAAKDDMDIPF